MSVRYQSISERVESMGKKTTYKPFFVRGARGSDGHFDGFLQGPLVSVLEHVLAAGDLDDGAIHAAIGDAAHVLDDAARQGEDLGTELAAHDLAHGGFVLFRDGGRAGFDALHAQLSHGFGDAHLLGAAEEDAGLLLAIAQGKVVDFDLLGKLEAGGDFGQEVPGANEPVFRVPGGMGHAELLMQGLPENGMRCGAAYFSGS